MEDWIEIEMEADLLSPSWPQVKEIVVKVSSEEQKGDVLKAVRREWDEAGTLSQEERNRREAMIRFVVDD